MPNREKTTVTSRDLVRCTVRGSVGVSVEHDGRAPLAMSERRDVGHKRGASRVQVVLRKLGVRGRLLDDVVAVDDQRAQLAQVRSVVRRSHS